MCTRLERRNVKSPMLERLNSLWLEGRLGYIEQLCLVSARSLGHPFTLYSYKPETLSRVPNGVEIRDAREVMSDENLVRYFDTGWAALGSDFFRYSLLAKGLGYWVDMDLYFIKPFDFADEYVFGWENDLSINGAVLRIPAQSAMLQDMINTPRLNWRPPFFGPKRSLLYYWSRLTKGDVHAEDLPWGTFGPGLLTHFAKKHGVATLAQERSVFYPVQYTEAHALFGTSFAIEEKITKQTRAVHMWHSHLGRLTSESPPRGSYLDVVCRQHGVET